MFYQFYTYELLRQLLPPILRRPAALALLAAAAKPLDSIYGLFNAKRVHTNLILSFNAYTIYLEKFLNDLFELEGEIYIMDFRDDYAVYLPDKKLAPVLYLSDRTSGGDTIFLPSDSPSDMQGGFNIHIPADIDTPANRAIITKWANFFKFAGTRFNIIAE